MTSFGRDVVTLYADVMLHIADGCSGGCSSAQTSPPKQPAALVLLCIFNLHTASGHYSV